MPRVISFIVLLAIVLLVGAVFFQVMAQFIVPLFLACVLLVVFQPLHARILHRLPGHPRVAAVATTVLILLAVLLPLTWLGWKAYVELYALVKPMVTNVAIVTTDDAEVVITENDSSPDGNDTIDGAAEDKTATSHPSRTPEWLRNIAVDLRNRFHETTTYYVEDETVEEILKSIPGLVGHWALAGVPRVIGVLVGLAIMVLSLYYFLADGPAMIGTVMYLSPLNESYEKELLERFGDVSRAVVVATLLSAVIQGALAGLGYVWALPSTAPIFLLTVVTMVTAMIPFVGAAAVWICVCAYVYLYGDTTTAIILAVYCTFIVSGIDNVIKPFILHGQSKLHPLLALLSILGGVQVLGPVGILVGPMLVSFLQALLHMLRRELDLFGSTTPEELAQLAIGEGGAVPVVEVVDSGENTADSGAKNVANSSTGKQASEGSKASKFAGLSRAKRKRGR